MQIYSCTVRLNGSLYNEVMKIAATAAEIVLLRTIHGQGENAGEPVINIKHTGTVKRSDKAERERLDEIYAGALAKIKNVGSINGVFGIGASLPKVAETEDVSLPSEEIDDDLADLG